MTRIPVGMGGVMKMYEKVLLPLDGSELAECVFPFARALAEGGLTGKIILLNVVEIPSAWSVRGIDLLAVKKYQADNAQSYLADVKTEMSRWGVRVETEVMEGDAAHLIAQYAESNTVKLIIIATHGYTGMKRLMFGSVALRVLHDARVPVMLIRPESSMTALHGTPP